MDSKIRSVFAWALAPCALVSACAAFSNATATPLPELQLDTEVTLGTNTLPTDALHRQSQGGDRSISRTLW